MTTTAQRAPQKQTCILICGSRHWTDPAPIALILYGFAHRADQAGVPRGEVVLINGFARGADKIASRIGKDLGFDVRDHQAEWERHGDCWCKDLSKSCGYAGFRRNREMLLEEPTVVFGFTDDIAKSDGTRDMIEIATADGIPAYVIGRHALVLQPGIPGT